jgi:RNA 3'-terminal phosphate cyclase (ATP)
MVTGKAVKISNIRSGRAKSGLMRQHLTAIQAASEICGAKVEGAVALSKEIVFQPGVVKSGEYSFAIGTAGSTSLVLQTVLFPLLATNQLSQMRLEGGTHNSASPSFDFLQRSFAPILKNMGMNLDLKIEKHGFFPAGGGRISAEFVPTTTKRPLSLTERGPVESIVGTAIFSNLPVSIPKRELEVVQQQLGLTDDKLKLLQVPSNGPGNVLTIEVRSREITEIFTVFGEKRVLAEDLALELCREVKEYIASDTPVGSHLADQLLLAMVCGEGGEFLTSKPSLHTMTNMEVIHRFVDNKVELERISEKKWRFYVKSPSRFVY